ncbi:peptidylprolyl isomerase [Acinetobacter sp. NCu2D-2]|uniref:peptidylprolyl isomerase n=1 Tax=Acinetobacter sp. NCu2D-2 TaxID=1608473 RepID=UPI0007CDDD62|nr:peptidylprolyl isomerase [Acinetobacter sp. NCu2D-2]ANF82942.1 peptidylprolyl isomerase [Acinetobacter sp. NCu2D-2]
MLKQNLAVLAGVLISTQIFAANTQVEINTSLGKIEVELYNDKAPITTKNFEDYIKSGFYNGTIFHRTITDFMVQGGGFEENMQEKDNPRPAIINESSNGLTNKRGTLAMARTNQPNSARSQFFINVKDNDFLNRSVMNAGYAVFGEVKKGMEIVDQMSIVPTHTYNMHQNVPRTPIKIIKMRIKPAPQVKQ